MRKTGLGSNTLYVAAGGGGDVLGAVMVALSRGARLSDLSIASYAWERKRFDPAVGPRGPSDFDGLERVGPDVWRITPETRLRRGRSFLPALAARLGCSLYLLDPEAGVGGLSRQMDSIAQRVGARKLGLVDVGGDILARGREPGLRSPMADSMALAAAHVSGLASRVLAVGIGLDGELTATEAGAAKGVATRQQARADPVVRVTPASARVIQQCLAWHPSEVAGLTCMAALGFTGVAEVRGDGMHVRLRGGSADIHAFETSWLFERSTVARALVGTSTFDEADRAIRHVVGRSELDDERRMLLRRRAYRTQWLQPPEIAGLERRLLDYSSRAERVGVRYLTLRRVSEVLSLSPRPFSQLLGHLGRRHPSRLQPPAWHTASIR